jgi:hypothetical protein
MSSQPTSELGGDTVDDAFAALQARKSDQEQPEQEEAEEEEEQEESYADSEPEEEQELAPPPKAKIKVGEEELEVDELVAGYMKDADYRRKTAEVAEAKRATQERDQQVAAERSHYANHLDVVLGSLQSQLIGDQQALAQLAQTNPAEWVAENAKFQQRYANYQQAVNERQRISQQQAYEEQQSYQRYVANEESRLLERMPSWKDPAKAAAVQTEIAQSLAKDYGYTAEELSSIADHRALLVAHDAMLWRKHVSGQKQAQSKVPPAAVKSGNPNQSPVRNDVVKSAEKRLRSSGSIEDAMAVMAASRRK